MPQLSKRIPEDELMDVKLHAEAYARADFSEPNARFVTLFSEKFPAFCGKRILDLGCGPADITVRLAVRYPQAAVTGVDGASAMLALARQTILQHSSLASRVDVRKWHIGRESSPLLAKAFDAVASNSLLHHMRDPQDLWEAIRACAAPQAAVLAMDLMRPETLDEAETIVETYAAHEADVLKADFLNSLLAAYRPAEIRKQLDAANMESLQVEIVSDRHLAIFGAAG